MSNTPPSRKLSLPEKVLNRVSNAVCTYPRLFFYPQVVLFLACIYYTAFSSHHLEFDSSRNDLVGSDKLYHQDFLKFKDEFRGQDDIVTVVESDDQNKNRQFVERLGARLDSETNLFTDVFYKGDLKMLGNKALLFLDDDDLVEMEKQMHEYSPFIQKFSQATNLNRLFQLINRQILTAKEEDNSENQSLMKAIPALERIIREATDAMKRPGTAPSPGVTMLFGGGHEAEERMYNPLANGRIYLVVGHARTEDLEHEAVKRMRELAAETQREVPGVNVGITGEPVLEVDEMAQSEHDTMVAAIVSLVICAFIFIYGYNESGRPIKATASLIIGLGFTMGYTTWSVGHLNILTITFAPMLIGIAIDFGVHLVTRYEEELRHGRTEQEALHKAMVYTGMGIFTGALTTAGAFFAMSFTDFRGIQEMGVIAGGGLLVCLVPMMTFLPTLLLRGRQNSLDHAPLPTADKRARIEQLWLDRPVLVIGITATLCLLALAAFPKVHFDYNLLNMQSAGLPAVVFEKKLIYSGKKSVLFAAVTANSPAEAIALEKKLTNLTTVAEVESMTRFLTGDQTHKLEIVRRIKASVSDIQFAPVDVHPVNVPELSLTLYGFQGYIGQVIDHLHQDKEADTNLVQQLVSLHHSIDPLREGMNADKATTSERLSAFQQALLRDVQETFAAIRNQDSSGPLTPESLPKSFRDRFIGRTGKYLLMVFPKEDVWRREPQERFVNELRTVYSHVTGTPVQLLEYTTLLKNSYIQAAWYSLAAIAVMVMIHFRSASQLALEEHGSRGINAYLWSLVMGFGCVVLALMPVAIGMIWMGGFMGWFGIPFNPANIMTLPLVVGVGVTNGIHILNRFAEEQNPGILAKSTGKAVLVSGLMTISGFGSLILAKHQGIQSLGYVMAVGTATCMIAGLTFLPSVLTLLMKFFPTTKKPGGGNALPPPGSEEPKDEPQSTSNIISE